MSSFDAALAAADPVLDGVFGTRVRITPMQSSPNARPGQDAGRTAWEGTAVVSGTTRENAPESTRGGTRVKFALSSVVAERSVSITRSALGGLSVVRGDVVTLLSEPGEPRSTVEMVDRADPTRVVLYLSMQD